MTTYVLTFLSGLFLGWLAAWQFTSEAMSTATSLERERWEQASRDYSRQVH